MKHIFDFISNNNFFLNREGSTIQLHYWMYPSVMGLSRKDLSHHLNIPHMCRIIRHTNKEKEDEMLLFSMYGMHDLSLISLTK